MSTPTPATPADTDAIMELERAGFPERERWSEQAWAAEIGAADRDVLLARDGERAIGVITVQTVEEVSDLLRVVVAPEARRRGVGTGLITAGVRAARDRGARQMTLEVRWDNDAAIACYQRVGFEQLGCRHDYYGPGQDALILRLYDLAHLWPSTTDRAARTGDTP